MPSTTRASAHPTKAVRLEAFDIQGHNGSGPLDYASFFSFIAAQNPNLRRERIADRLIAVPSFVEIDGRYSFVAYAGSSETSFLVLDLASDTEEIRHIEDGKVIATRTVGTIDPLARRAVIQYVHTGVRAAQVAALFEKLAHTRSTEFEGATLEFAPRAGRTFKQQIVAMERIQSASVTLTRPNYDWTDYSNAINELAGDSEAHNIEVAASAPRNGTLSKSKGVVQVINKLVDGTRSIIKSAVIKGLREGDSAPITLNLNKHIESRMAKVPLSSEGLPSTPDIVKAAIDFMAPTDGE